MIQDRFTVYKWTEKNNMKSNGTKFKHLHYGKNLELKNQSINHSDTGTDIVTKTSEKYLGVIMSIDTKS